jgi:phospholipid/cholesterol/gamma-HCH transport system substrate-binding protein
METRANYIIVGVFTLLAVLAAFGFVYWSAGIGGGADTSLLRVRIPGSAAGLGRGSAVLFNGVKVGDVIRVYIDVTNPGVAIADTQVDSLTPITRSTKADIGIAGLTGQANIELSGGNIEEPNLLVVAEETGETAQITADPSAVTNLLQTAQDIMQRADAVVQNLEEFVAEARVPLTETVENAQRFSEALSRNADGVDTFLANFGELSESLGGVSGQLDETLQAARGILEAVQPERVENIVANIEKFSAGLDQTSDELTRIMTGVDAAVQSIGPFMANATETLGRVDTIVTAVDPAGVKAAIANIEVASRDAREISADVSKFTAGLSERQDDVDKIISDASQLTSRLNQASARVDGLMAGIDTAVGNVASFSRSASGTIGKVDKILEGVDPANVKTALANIAEASETAKKVAADIDNVTERFGQRSEDIDQIITDTQQLASRLNQASVRVDGVLAKLDGLLGSGEAEGVVVEATETIRAFRQVADTLNARIGTITDGLARFSGDGLRDVEALVTDSRRAITRIEQAITDLERNPQRIITGGEGPVPRYDGRARR